MFKLLLALMSIGVLAFPARAAEPTPLPTAQSVEELLTVTRTEAQIQLMYEQFEAGMRAGMQQAVAGQRLTEKQQGFIDAAPKEFIEVMKAELSWDKVKPIFVGVYRENFTQAEIDGMLAFYNSPVGQAFVTKMPAVVQRSSQAMQVLAAPMAEKMRAAMQRALEKAQSAG